MIIHNDYHDKLKVKDGLSVGTPDRTYCMGFLGRRLNSIRENRLNRLINVPFMVNQFDPVDRGCANGPVTFFEGERFEGTFNAGFIGESFGKWLHAATLTGLSFQDEELISQIVDACNRVVSFQEEGYIGTYHYPKGKRFCDPLRDGTIGWDIWVIRYTMYSLLIAWQYFGENKWLESCTKMADLVVDVYSREGRNIATETLWEGLVGLVILEPILMLYKVAGDEKYLNFAKHIIYESSEKKTKIISKLKSGEKLQNIAKGKIYELMSVLLGVLDLYRFTGSQDLLECVDRAWEEVKAEHLHITGGPWGVEWFGECFSAADLWTPFRAVETCDSVLWIQLSLSMLRLKGESKYMDEAERSAYNHLMGAHRPDAWECSYYTRLNESPDFTGERFPKGRQFNPLLHCCNSNVPRGFSILAGHIYGKSHDGVAVNIYEESTGNVTLANGANVRLRQHTTYPLDGRVEIVVDPDRPMEFPIYLRVPDWAEETRVRVNGLESDVATQSGHYAQLKHLWKCGDVIEVELPMDMRVHKSQFDNKRTVAFQRGPLVYAALGIKPEIEGTLPKVKEGTSPVLKMKKPATLGALRYSLDLEEPVSDMTGGKVRTVSLRPYCELPEIDTSVATCFEVV